MASTDGAVGEGQQEATYDSLTGLLDRASFLAEVTRVLAKASDGSGPRSAVLFIDLDEFKDVNDRYGHLAGDQVLVTMCRRIQSVLRTGYTLGRLGGDELAVFVQMIHTADEPAHVAERIVRACDDDVALAAAPDCVRVSASVGVALSDGTAQPAETLIHQADRAMYRAKAEGGGRWNTFASSFDERPRDHALEAGAAIDHARRSIRRAERCITDLWRDVVDLKDESLTVSLVDVTHSLRAAARELGRHAERCVPSHSRTGEPAKAPDGAAVSSNEDRVCVRMWGEHDRSNVGVLRRALIDAIAAADLDVRVDMRHVTFIDASIVGILIRSRALLASLDRRLTLQSPAPRQRRMLEICNLAALIEEAPEDEPAQDAGAPTALASWVKVPATPRIGGALPHSEVELPREEFERTRR